MQNLTFKADAQAFVIKHGCANSAGVELIQEAMEIGATKMADAVVSRLKESAELIEKKRIAGKMHEHQPRQIELP